MPKMYWHFYPQNPDVADQLTQEETFQILQQQPGIVSVRRGWSGTYGEVQYIVEHLARRCWRFPQLHAECYDETFRYPTLVVRRWMLDLALPEIVKARTDAFLSTITGPDDLSALVRGLSYSQFRHFSHSDDYCVKVAWDIYRYRQFQQYAPLDRLEASIAVVEDYLLDPFWDAVRKRAATADQVTVTQIGEQKFTASGSQTYAIDTKHLTCTCMDYVHRGHRGVLCKHLIAALKIAGLWERYWSIDQEVDYA